MQEILTFAILGTALGAIYGLAALGLVVTYRGSGVLNFGHGAMALLGAALYMEMLDRGAPKIVAVLVPLVVMAVLGAAVALLVMRPLRRASALARLVATLGLLGVITSAAQIRYGNSFRFVKGFLPSHNVKLAGGVSLGQDRLWIIGISVVVTAILFVIYRRTAFGRATSAVAENQRSAASLGVSPDLVATANWALGGALAALAGILIVPITGFAPGTIALVIVPVLASAMVGGFSSFVLTLVGGVAVGIAQSEITRYVQVSGWAQAAPFLVIIALLIVRGRALPLRGYLTDRLPSVAPVRRRRWLVLGALALAAVLISTGDGDALASLSSSFGVALIALSVVVVTGYAGQVSLAQYSLAGVGAFIAARLSDTQGLPFLVVLVIGILGAIPFGLLFALPALRTRGVNLAVATLGLAVAVQSLLLNNKDYTGGQRGTVVRSPTLFGWSINAVDHPQRYAWTALGLFALFGLLVSNLRRGRAGRRLLATRANERAAASLGISVVGAKLYAFCLGAAVAAAGGVILAFSYPNVDFSVFDVFSSINAVVLTFLGGIGFVSGALLGGAIAVGGFLTQLINRVIDLGEWTTLITSTALILMVIQDPNGIAYRWSVISGAVTRRLPHRTRPTRAEPPPAAVERCDPRTLRAEGITMRFGGVVALDGVDVEVRPGEIVGLIGPNGAGKTTLIDVITGFTKPTKGRIGIDDVDLTALSARRRSQLGVGRSFQNLELFEDLTVEDNLRVAAEDRNLSSYLTDLVRPTAPQLGATARRAIIDFELTDDLARTPSELSYGRRRLVAIARSVARHPSVLLLDEPAAGLDEGESRELGQLVRRIADEWGTGILLVEHDMGLVMEVCDRVVVLDFGRKIADGTPAAVSADERVVAAYLGAADGAGPATPDPALSPAGQAADAQAGATV